MRIKASDGPLSIHNGNTNNILNSPKRINTVQNSSYNNYNTSTLTADTGDTLNNNHPDQLQWFNASQKQQEYIKNNNRNHQLINNINNTLATSLRSARQGALFPEVSPDDSYLNFESKSDMIVQYI